jgi:serralysin
MSYFPQSNLLGFSNAYPMTPQIADIAAVQEIYGAATNTRTSNTCYGFNSNAMSQVGSNVFITVDAQDSIKLTGVSINQLGADDFLFI